MGTAPGENSPEENIFLANYLLSLHTKQQSVKRA